MNIRNGIDNISQIFPSAAATSTLPGAALGKVQEEGLGGDQASLSVASGHLAQAAAVSDVRLDKVASVQSAIEAGTYNVAATEVAKKLVSSMLSMD